MRICFLINKLRGATVSRSAVAAESSVPFQTFGSQYITDTERQRNTPVSTADTHPTGSRSPLWTAMPVTEESGRNRKSSSEAHWNTKDEICKKRGYFFVFTKYPRIFALSTTRFSAFQLCSVWAGRHHKYTTNLIIMKKLPTFFSNAGGGFR